MTFVAGLTLVGSMKFGWFNTGQEIGMAAQTHILDRHIEHASECRPMGIVTLDAGRIIERGMGVCQFRIRGVMALNADLLLRRNQQSLRFSRMGEVAVQTTIIVHDRRMGRFFTGIQDVLMTEAADLFWWPDEFHVVAEAMKPVAGIAVFLIERIVIKFSREFFKVFRMTFKTFSFTLGSDR